MGFWGGFMSQMNTSQKNNQQLLSGRRKKTPVNLSSINILLQINCLNFLSSERIDCVTAVGGKKGDRLIKYF
jgi:hypothetical protein